MSHHLPPTVTAQLVEVAEALVEGFSARGHAITTATEADPSFDNGIVVSSTRRSLAMAEARAAASRVGLDPRSVSGGLDLRSMDDVTERRFRLRTAKRSHDGDLSIVCSSDSALAIDVDNPARLIDVEQWVFAIVYGEAREAIDEIVAARVVDRTATVPGYLVLDNEQSLYRCTSTPPAGGGFRPSDEPLRLDDAPGLGDEDDRRAS